MEKYIHLSTILIKEWTSGKEIKQRITLAKKAFNRKKQLFCCKLDLELQKILMNCHTLCIRVMDAEKNGKE